MNRRRRFPLAPALAALATLTPMAGTAESVAPARLAYSDLADLGLAAPIAALVRVADAVEVGKEQRAGLRPGFSRFYVEADLVSLIRSPDPLPTRVTYVADLAPDARGKPARPRKGTDFLIFAVPVAGHSGALQLAAPDAQLAYAPGDVERLRAILRESGTAGAPPLITGIGRAFHVAGSLPGESETQIFLRTADGRPVSLSILRRPGETPRWSAALSEIVDDAAAPPARDTLLWYRLACALPPAPPAAGLADASSPEDAAAISDDYRLVIESLGPCGRMRSVR
jgi:hypothetical protein